MGRIEWLQATEFAKKKDPWEARKQAFLYHQDLLAGEAPLTRQPDTDRTTAAADEFYSFLSGTDGRAALNLLRSTGDIIAIAVDDYRAYYFLDEQGLRREVFESMVCGDGWEKGSTIPYEALQAATRIHSRDPFRVLESVRGRLDLIASEARSED